MRFVDDRAELRLRQPQHLQRLDVLDQRELRGGQRREREAAAPCPHHEPIALGAQRHIGALGRGAQDIEQFAARHRHLARRGYRQRRGAHEFHLEVRTGHAQAVVLRAEQHIREHRHGLAPFDDTDHVLHGTEEFFTGGGDFHVLKGVYELRGCSSSRACGYGENSVKTVIFSVLAIAPSVHKTVTSYGLPVHRL